MSFATFQLPKPLSENERRKLDAMDSRLPPLEAKDENSPPPMPTFDSIESSDRHSFEFPNKDRERKERRRAVRFMPMPIQESPEFTEVPRR